LRDVIAALGGQLTQVTITELRDEVFYAELTFADGTTVSARPSDAIALALRTGTAISAEDAVLSAVGIAIADEDETEVERFREFLDTISADDFVGSEGGASEGVPDGGVPEAGASDDGVSDDGEPDPDPA
jgi:hypothetical protein